MNNKISIEDKRIIHPHLLVDDREASSISVDHSWKDGVSGRSGITNSSEMERNADELLHLTVVLCPHLL